MTTPPLLDIRNLTVEFATRRGTVQAVKAIDIQVGKGETVAIVGESGSGKSVTSYAVVRILDRAGSIAEGAITFAGVDLVGASETQMCDLRGREISMVFQNPRAALNPIRKVGKQIEDVLLQHVQATRATARDKAIEALAIGLGDRRHVGGVLEAPLDLEAGHARLHQLGQQRPGRQILGRQQIALLAQIKLLAVDNQLIGQAAGLSALPPVGAALA